MMENRTIINNDSFFTEVEKILLTGHIVTLPTKGNSMFPFIVGERDQVILQKMESIHIADIVLARIEGQGHVLHRIIRIEKEKITLMGDGNLCGTEKCQLKDISGTVVEIIRNGKQIDCSSLYECYKVKLWMALLPIRRYLLGIYKRWNKLICKK